MAQFRLKENPDNANALFAMAISLGMQADYTSLIEKHEIESLKKMQKADKYSKRLLKVDPALTTPILDWEWRITSLAVCQDQRSSFSGSRESTATEKGIQQIEITAKKGHYLRPFAKVLLALTALREKKPEVARTELTELVSEFPENPLFASELAKLNASPAGGTPKSSPTCPNPR